MKDSGRNILNDVLLGVAVTAALLAAKMVVEHTSWGHRAEMAAFELLQGQLSPFNPNEELPVVVVDISDIGAGKDNDIVDLDKLQSVVKAIADQKPKAIAIDAELMPHVARPGEDNHGESEAVHERQERNYFNFLDFCLKTVSVEKNVPVYVAVLSASADMPEEWLGQEQYKPLAATALVPKNDTTRMLIWFRGDPSYQKLPSISASLASSSRGILIPAGLSWAIESTSDRFPGSEMGLPQEMDCALALVNYSKLEAIEQNKLLTISETSVRESGEKFRNRMVVLGDGTKEKAVDRFVVPGRDQPVPGVYIHASAAYTFAREPMFELRPWVRVMLDVLLSLLIIGIVVFARVRHLRDRKTFDWHKFQGRIVLGSLVGVGILAVIFVRYTGVLWLDFLIVMLALWLHPKVEKFFLGSK